MKKRKIQIPNNVLCNKNINHMCFYLYYILKKISYNNLVTIRGKELRDILNWKQPETLKKYLPILKKENVIYYDFEDIPKHKNMEITINTFKDNFTQAEQYKIDLIEEKSNSKINISKSFKEMSIRLYYFYIKNTNSNLGIAFPSFRYIYQETKINQIYIKEINNFLIEVNLLQVVKGGWNIIDNVNEIYKQAPNQYKVK